MNNLFLESSIGVLKITADENYLLKIELVNQKESDCPNAICRETAKQLQEYFEGKRKEFVLPLKIEGTAFNRDVLAALRTVLYAHTCSYGQLALNSGHGKASRAVGNVIHNNPYPIVIPCHRVVKSDDNLGGFAWGTDIKKQLLRLEKKYASSID